MPSSGIPDDDEGIAGLGRDVAEDAVRLVRAEINLARAEFAHTLRQLRTALILFAIAAFLLLFTLVAALGTLADGVGSYVLGGAWKAWGILAILFLVGAAILGLRGYRAVSRSIADTRDAVGTLKEDAAWLKLLTRRREKGS